MNQIEYVECLYCNIMIDAEDNIVPTIDDNEAWERLALNHSIYCEWIKTRAHNLLSE